MAAGKVVVVMGVEAMAAVRVAVRVVEAMAAVVLAEETGVVMGVEVTAVVAMAAVARAVAARVAARAVVARVEERAGCPMPRQRSTGLPVARLPPGSCKGEDCCQPLPRAARQHGRAHTLPKPIQAYRRAHSQ